MKNLWIYDKSKRKAKPQAVISLYITTSTILSIIAFFCIFMLAKRIYGYVPRQLTMLSMFIIIGVPAGFVLWNYSLNFSPKIVIRSYPIYLDDNGELWLFDYNCQAFEDYYESHALPTASKSRTESRFKGTLKERAVEYCVANNAVKDIIGKPPYDAYAHHIVQVGKIVEKSNYLRVQFLCHSNISNKNYPAALAFPLDMDGLDELRSVFESKASGDGMMPQPKEYNEPGVMRIDSIYEDKDGMAILYGIMEKGTISRGDRVNYIDESDNVQFSCKIAHLFRDGHEIVWATPVEDGNEPGYEIHVKGRSGTDFKIGCCLHSK